MAVTNDNLSKDIKKILEALSALEARVERLEDYLEVRPLQSRKSQRLKNESGQLAEISLESRIGEFWLAHLGTVVLLLGIAFFISYPFKAIAPVLRSLLGYLAVASIFLLSRYWQKTYQYLAKILFGGGLVLLYFATLRLYFFSQNPVLPNKAIGLAAIVIVLAYMLYLSLKRQSQLLTGIILFICYTTSLLSDTAHFALLLITCSSIIAGFTLFRYDWKTVAAISIFFAYTAHLLWLLNNPILGKPLQAIPHHYNNIIYLFLYGAIFSGAYLGRKKPTSEFFEILLALLNALGFCILSSLVALTFFKSHIASIQVLMAIFLICVGIFHWSIKQLKYASATYASFGFMALSVAIFAHFQSPHYFIWLSLQSLLVISVAIWFHSRILILVNILIFLSILVTYLYLAPSSDWVNLSYAVVALVSARILNWKKQRLELKTDMIRNAYLASAFVVVLYGLYQAVPARYLSLSWLGAALFYFAISLVLKNIKYRWMAILTIFATVLRVLFIDMANLNAEFRIMLFLAVGGVLLVVSLVYAKYRKKLSQI